MFRLQKIPNTAIRSKIQAEQSILDRIKTRQLKWYGHLLKMENWSKKIYQRTPHGRRRRGRPQLSWRNQVTDFIKSRGMEEDMVEDRHLWRLGVDGRLLAVYILYIYIKIKICGLQLPREPHRLTRLLQLTGRWQYDRVTWLALHFVKYIRCWLS